MKESRISPHGPGAIFARRSIRKAGTTLVEVLVVIVVLLIGILAVVQVFPGGLRILTMNRNSMVATALAQDEAERIQSRSEQIPEAIVPVIVTHNGTEVLTQTDENRRPDEITGLVPGSITGTGNIVDGSGNNIAYWPLASGPNLFRRVIGEGGRVPAPRQVGDYFGGLMVLQFTPIAFNRNTFKIYGADMIRRIGPPQEGDTPQRFEYYVKDIDTPDAELIIPADPFAERHYRLVASYYVQVGSGAEKHDVVDKSITVAPTPGGGFYSLPLNGGDAQNPDPLELNGANLLGVEMESVRLARIYDEVQDVSQPFTDPYEYKLLNSEIGLILFSDQAYNAYESRNGRRVPLQAHVNYDVYDWRVMRDEFRVPDGELPQVKLALGNLKIKNNTDVDGNKYLGLNLNLQSGKGSTERRDIAFMDLDTGGVYLESSASRTDGSGARRLINVDRSLGLVTFNDADGNRDNGVQGELVYPGASDPVDVNLNGRAIRAMYQCRGEWVVQVAKAPSILTQSAERPGYAQYYVGGTSALGGSPTRIYFSQSTSGQRVTIEQIYYRRTADTTARALENQSFIVQSTPADPTGLAYVDIQSVDSSASTFDITTYGFAVRGARGASVSIRVLWNPATLSFTSDTAANLRAFEVWGREWRRTTTETYVRRSGE